MLPLATSPISEAMVAVMVRIGEMKEFSPAEHGRRVAGHHHHRHGLAQRTPDAQHHGGQDASLCGRQHHAPNDLPLRRPQGVSRVAVGPRHGIQRVFSDRNDGRDRDERQQKGAGEGGQPGGQIESLAHEGRQDQDADKAQDDRRDARQDFDGGFEDLVHAPGRDLADVDGSANAQGQGDQDGEYGDDQMSRSAAAGCRTTLRSDTSVWRAGLLAIPRPVRAGLRAAGTGRSAG